MADLQDAISGSSRIAPARRQGEIFAFIGAKGGVGATTIAVNVATALAQARAAQTLLVDLSRGGDAAVFLGAEPRFSIVDALENTHRLDEAFFAAGRRTKAGRRPAGVVRTGDRAAFRARRDPDALEFAARPYRYIVLDVPRSDAAVLDSLERRHEIVVVANQELATVRSASRMAATLRQRYGQDADGRPEPLRRWRRSVRGRRSAVGVEGRAHFPSDYRLALQAMNKGRPLVLENHNELSRRSGASPRTLRGVRSSRKQARRAAGRLRPPDATRLIRSTHEMSTSHRSAITQSHAAVDMRHPQYQELKAGPPGAAEPAEPRAPDPGAAARRPSRRSAGSSSACSNASRTQRRSACSSARR